MSDFSLMDAIECGIVKLPRVPVAENIPGDEMPMFRNLWENIRQDMPKKGRGQGERPRPAQAPSRACRRRSKRSTATTRRPSSSGKKAGIRVPPCFIIVCQNTAISKLVYDFISGFEREQRRRHARTLVNGRLALFRNFDESTGNPLARPNTLLIDSEQLESGDALDDELPQHGGRRDRPLPPRDQSSARAIRGRREHHRPGTSPRGHEHRWQAGTAWAAIRCVVSVSMLTEGWDANTVTHVSAFAPSARSCCASRSSGARCAGSRTS